MSIASISRRPLRRAAWAALTLCAAFSAHAQQVSQGWTASRPIRTGGAVSGRRRHRHRRAHGGRRRGQRHQASPWWWRTSRAPTASSPPTMCTRPPPTPPRCSSARPTWCRSARTPIRNVKFKPDSFTPVAPIAKIGVVLAGRPGLQARTLQDLIADARQRQYTAHWGVGSNGHIGMEIFRLQSGAQKMLDVPYLGTAPALVALLAGQVDLMLVPTPLVIANRREAAGVRRGRPRALRRPEGRAHAEGTGLPRGCRHLVRRARRRRARRARPSTRCAASWSRVVADPAVRARMMRPGPAAGQRRRGQLRRFRHGREPALGRGHPLGGHTHRRLMP